MKIISPFKIGQKVWSIANESVDYIETCETCKGEGMITHYGVKFLCPDSCVMGQKRKRAPAEWMVIDEPRTVGQIRVEITDSPGYPCGVTADNYAKQKSRKDQCMCIETGIDSGNVYTYNEHVFTSQESAQTECDKRNNEKDPQ